ncbi:NAD(P)-dependent oxidoreductase [Cryobacterium lactosi]|uniref:NAD(P)-dependent oxidoreductase n=1 Tax=Cryobacterium lactosi TaxID=1259202 RepID=A0A4R9BTD6_9MICO|nr:NAD(P)-dependent oxidoreductase [Cryobacterium lactosi]TFD90638.1 NAD(P)-dependent oxidoreductase [Cryobacterium lactosi]
MRIIVTGGSGRLGQSVVRGLGELGHEVLSIDRIEVDGLPARQLTIDLLDHSATTALMAAERPDAVVHLAAIAVPFSAPEATILATNSALTFNVLDAASAAGAGRVLAASSPTVIGYGSPTTWEPRYLPLDEAHPVRPWNAYALSKLGIENTAAMFARQRGESTVFGSFRPCFVISPEEWDGAITQQGHTVVERLNDPALAAVSLFNYLDARDAAAFVACWLENAHLADNGEVFFVGAADALATRPVAELLPDYLPGCDACGLTGTLPAFSSAHAERVLGWRPTRSWRTELSPSQAALLHSPGTAAPTAAPDVGAPHSSTAASAASVSTEVRAS